MDYNKMSRQRNNGPIMGGPPVDGGEDIEVIVEQQENVDPMQCMEKYLNGPYATCGADMPQELKDKAFEIFKQVTGFTNIGTEELADAISADQQTMLAYTAYYIFVPIMFLSWILIWIGFGYGMYDWPLALLLSTLTFIVLYFASVFYRINAQVYLDQRNTFIKDNVDASQQAFNDSVAFWPQAMYAIACAVAGDDWECNDPCKNCVRK